MSNGTTASYHQNDFASLRLDGDSRLQNLIKLVQFLSEKPGVVLTRYEVYVTITHEGEGTVDGLPQYNSYIIKEGEPEVILDNKKKTSECQTAEDNLHFDTQTQFISTDTRYSRREDQSNKLDTLNRARSYVKDNPSRPLLDKTNYEVLVGATDTNVKEITGAIHHIDVGGEGCLSSESDTFLTNSSEDLLKTVLKSAVSSDFTVHVENSVNPEQVSAKVELLEEEERPFKCMKCSASFQKEESLIVHGLFHTSSVKAPLFFECPRCNFKCKSTTLIRGHVQEMHKLRVHLCLWCKFVAFSTDQLAEHKSQTSHESIVRRKIVENQKITSTDCASVMVSTSPLEKSTLVHLENTDYKYKCQFCFMQFDKARDLLAHVNIHGSGNTADIEKPFNCGQCFYRTHSTLFLQRHVMAAHSGERKYQCKDCSSVFKSMRKLRKHAEAEHNNTDFFFCSFCTFSCSGKKEHRYHLQSHYGRDRFSCDQCEYTCLHSCDMKRHQLTHTDTKPYGCCICGRHFRAKNNMIKHVATHQEERDHQCETCGFRTKSKGLLKDHQRVHQDVKEHMCQHCGYSTKYRGNLYKHMLTHTEVKAFSCDLCPYTAKTTENLNRHKKRKHKIVKYRQP